MFDYVRKYSSSAHQVCCEDSPTKGLNMTITSPRTLLFTQGHNCISYCTILFNILTLFKHRVLLVKLPAKSHIAN